MDPPTPKRARNRYEPCGRAETCGKGKVRLEGVRDISDVVSAFLVPFLSRSKPRRRGNTSRLYSIRLLAKIGVHLMLWLTGGVERPSQGQFRRYPSNLIERSTALERVEIFQFWKMGGEPDTFIM